MLSFAQERFWFLDQFEPNSAFYNLPIALRLYGPLNHLCLEKSFNAVIQRHESLRTIFPAKEGKPYEKVIPTDQVAFKLKIKKINCKTEKQ